MRSIKVNFSLLTLFSFWRLKSQSESFDVDLIVN
jgi:hypothetical protein